MSDSTRGGFIRFVGGPLHNRHIDLPIWDELLVLSGPERLRSANKATLSIGGIPIGEVTQISSAEHTYVLRRMIDAISHGGREYVCTDLDPQSWAGEFGEGVPTGYKLLR